MRASLFFKIEPTLILRYDPWMYQCSKQPFSGPDSAVLRRSYRFLKQWKEDTATSPPGVEVQSFEQPVLINWFRKHTDPKFNRQDKVRRYRLLPCVRELLENTTDPPFEAANGNFILEGMTPAGLEFRAVIKPHGQRLYLITCYPR